MFATTKDILNEIEVLPQCMAELVAHYARSDDEVIIAKLCEYFELNCVKMGADYVRIVNRCTFNRFVMLEIFVHVASKDQTIHHRFRTLFGCDCFFQNFKDFIQRHPQVSTILEKAYDSFLTMYSCFTK